MQKREKRRWIFRKHSTSETVIQHLETKKLSTKTAVSLTTNQTSEAEQRRAIAVAVATTAAAEAAVATAQAAVEVVRLTTPSFFITQHKAAVLIQTAFRGYMVISALSQSKQNLLF